MYGMPSRVRLLYHGFRGQREALSIDRDLDLAITEFAPGSQKTKDKRVYTAIGFTGPLLPDPAWHPATDNPFPRRMWMARCDQCQLQSDQPSASCITVRNLTDSAIRHPLLDEAHPGIRVALYGLEHNYRSGDYTETQNTVFFVTT